MGGRAAKRLGGHFLVGDGLDHIGTGDEHIRTVFDHKNEVGDCRRVDRAAGARTHHQRNLRHHARCQHIALKHFGIAAERRDPFLNACAARIRDADDRRADFHRLVHYLADFFRVRLRQRAAEHGEILAINEHQAAVDGAITGDHAVAGNALVLHAKIGAAVLDEDVPLLKTVIVKQNLNALARGQFALGMLRLNTLLATALFGLGAFLF